MGITHKTMESQRLLLRCFMLCTFVLWVGSCGDPHTGEVVSMDDTEQTKAVDKLTDLLHHEHKKSSISFSYSHSKATNLGEDSHKHAGAHKSGPADGLIQMGELLDGFKSLRSTSTGEAVSSLTSALRAKELMDTLKPSGPGSFGAAKKAKQAPSLGENGDKDSSHPTFHDLMHAKEKNMAAITQYLMARKGEGRPLTADKDQQLQKFYYNRASTILKKIVLLKQGQSPPGFNDPEHDDKSAGSPRESKQNVDPSDDQPSTSATGGEIDKLKYDAEVANDNTAYNDKRAHKLVDQEEAANAERKAEDREEMDSLAFDQKVAQANEQYNDKLLQEVQKQAKKAAEALQAGLVKQNRMSKVEKELQKQKVDAQQAVERFTREQEDAEGKVESAEKAKSEADAEAAKASKMLREAEAEANADVKAPKEQKKTHKMPHMLPAAERMSNMVQYLRTALSHHNTISQSDLQIMQSFFLQHGGQLLSKLAQIEPDATWTDKGVVGTEQWAMDHHHPDKLSQEWGVKKVEGATLVRDVLENHLENRHSSHVLQRPGTQQAVEGLFGMSAKLALKFAPDSSNKVEQEPSLGEGMDDAEEQHPNKFAYSSMLGIQ